MIIYMIQTLQSALQLAISRFGNFLYWFIHNEIAIPIFVTNFIINIVFYPIKVTFEPGCAEQRCLN